MQDKYTPGPWECWNDEGDIFVGDAVLSTVAQVWKDADARLIAAAPLMLEALKAVESVGYILEEWSEGDKALDKVIAAIRAATGEDA